MYLFQYSLINHVVVGKISYRQATDLQGDEGSGESGDWLGPG
jgi:hypothetical protein